MSYNTATGRSEYGRPPERSMFSQPARSLDFIYPPRDDYRSNERDMAPTRDYRDNSIASLVTPSAFNRPSQVTSPYFAQSDYRLDTGSKRSNQVRTGVRYQEPRSRPEYQNCPNSGARAPEPYDRRPMAPQPPRGQREGESERDRSPLHWTVDIYGVDRREKFLASGGRRQKKSTMMNRRSSTMRRREDGGGREEQWREGGRDEGRDRIDGTYDNSARSPGRVRREPADQDERPAPSPNDDDGIWRKESGGGRREEQWRGGGRDEGRDRIAGAYDDSTRSPGRARRYPEDDGIWRKESGAGGGREEQWRDGGGNEGRDRIDGAYNDSARSPGRARRAPDDDGVWRKESGGGGREEQWRDGGDGGGMDSWRKEGGNGQSWRAERQPKGRNFPQPHWHQKPPKESSQRDQQEQRRERPSVDYQTERGAAAKRQWEQDRDRRERPDGYQTDRGGAATRQWESPQERRQRPGYESDRGEGGDRRRQWEQPQEQQERGRREAKRPRNDDGGYGGTPARARPAQSEAVWPAARSDDYSRSPGGAAPRRGREEERERSRDDYGDHSREPGRLQPPPPDRRTRSRPPPADGRARAASTCSASLPLFRPRGQPPQTATTTARQPVDLAHYGYGGEPPLPRLQPPRTTNFGSDSEGRGGGGGRRGRKQWSGGRYFDPNRTPPTASSSGPSGPSSGPSSPFTPGSGSRSVGSSPGGYGSSSGQSALRRTFPSRGEIHKEIVQKQRRKRANPHEISDDDDNFVPMNVEPTTRYNRTPSRSPPPTVPVVDRPPPLSAIVPLPTVSRPTAVRRRRRQKPPTVKDEPITLSSDSEAGEVWDDEARELQRLQGGRLADTTRRRTLRTRSTTALTTTVVPAPTVVPAAPTVVPAAPTVVVPASTTVIPAAAPGGGPFSPARLLLPSHTGSFFAPVGPEHPDYEEPAVPPRARPHHRAAPLTAAPKQEQPPQPTTVPVPPPAPTPAQTHRTPEPPAAAAAAAAAAAVSVDAAVVPKPATVPPPATVVPKQEEPQPSPPGDDSPPSVPPPEEEDTVAAPGDTVVREDEQEEEATVASSGRQAMDTSSSAPLQNPIGDVEAAPDAAGAPARQQLLAAGDAPAAAARAAPQLLQPPPDDLSSLEQARLQRLLQQLQSRMSPEAHAKALRKMADQLLQQAADSEKRAGGGGGGGGSRC